MGPTLKITCEYVFFVQSPTIYCLLSTTFEYCYLNLKLPLLISKNFLSAIPYPSRKYSKMESRPEATVPPGPQNRAQSVLFPLTRNLTFFSTAILCLLRLLVLWLPSCVCFERNVPNSISPHSCVIQVSAESGFSATHISNFKRDNCIFPTMLYNQIEPN